MAFVAPATSFAAAPRIASINVCTDQLLLALADPAQIVGLSPYSRDGVYGEGLDAKRRFRRLSGEAEDVLMLKPDIVVTSRYAKPVTREMLQRSGQRVVGFDVAQSVADAKHQIAEMGDLTGHPDRARADIARIDAAIVRARAASARKPYRVLAVSRRGWVAGNGSLITALLEAAGLTNAAADLGLGQGGFASLEAIVSLRPDFILLSESSEFAEDQGRAFLFHPALERLYPPDKRLVVPERLTVCGGPMLADALDRLVSELQRVERASPR